MAEKTNSEGVGRTFDKEYLILRRFSHVFRRYRKRPVVWNGLRSNWKTRVLNKRIIRNNEGPNMLQLHRVLNEMSHLRYLVGFWIRICQGGEYNNSVLNMSGLYKVLNKTLRYIEIFDRMLNMPLVLKWQGYRELWVLRKLYSRDLWYPEYASGSQYNKIFNVTGILLC